MFSLFSTSKICVLVFLLSISVLYLLYYSRSSFVDFTQKNEIKRYLIETQKCKILDFPAFHPQVLPFYERELYNPCGPSEVLTSVTVENNTALLHINRKVLKWHPKILNCLYRKINQMKLKFKFEDFLNEPVFTSFENSVKIDSDYVFVMCLKGNKVFYSNTHAPIVLKENIIKRQKLMKNKAEAFSVLIIGIDSMSRLNFLRSLPETHLFLKENNWISLKGYNKVADNTYPNLMALLAGLDEPKADEKCSSRSLISCPLVLFDYQNQGYATAYAEDEPWMGNFILNQRSYDNPPTDYYFRPYFRVNEKLTTRKIDGVNFCTGPESSGERVLNLAKNFAKTLQNRPSFGVFWANGFNHNLLNLASSMDSKIRDFFKNITDSGILGNTFVFFLSDHGLRVGPFRQTPMGWLEERLPFSYIWVPVKFRNKFRRQYHNLQLNINQLTSPYHLYMTLQDILVLSKQNFKIKSSQGCSKCQSLFDSFEDRSCQDAGIDPHWCTCNTYPSIMNQSSLAQNASKYVLQYIHTKILDQNGAKKCLKYTLAKIISARVSHDRKYILLILETSPEAVFEVTVLHKPGSKQTFSVKGGISRLDRYAKHSYCTTNRLLRKLCYCR
ncbi:uncharacterized protein LOC123016064 isoform X2 [Tribolium madens]|uniref:uncharacterized protein LOC123016064 isoform X2 n=1 Tax=Tribolium madens TaxID=41895 RepID=UPI001CF728F9|nr:uncharacterized protein LOC123016064 isoform X2 [Tribolium madens]